VFQAPRGTSDILPEDQAYWRFIEKKIAAICQLYGYQRIDTPVFEDAGLFVRGVGEVTDIVQKEMYVFEDRGNNKLTLKPEGTAPVCRAYLEHGMTNLPQPVKLYYIGSSYRYERPQAGRYREFHQFGFEAIGDNDPALDAEVIDMAWQFYVSLGINQLHLKLNSIGCKSCRPAYLAKLKDYYTNKQSELCQDCRNRLENNTLRLLDCKNPYCQKLTAAAPKSYENLCPECSTHFTQLQKYITVLGLPIEIDHCLVRGLDYYTRTVFEIIEQKGAEDGTPLTLAGGGRYDYLARQMGSKKDVPSVGFSIGVDRIVESSWYKKLSPRIIKKPKIYFIQLGSEAKLKSLNIIEILRKAHVPIAQSLSKDSLGSQLAIAEKLAIPYAIIFGVKEALDNSVIVRDMSNRSQETVKLSKLLDYLKEIK